MESNPTYQNVNTNPNDIPNSDKIKLKILKK